MEKYSTSLSLTKEEWEQLGELRNDGFSIIEVFRVGLSYARVSRISKSDAKSELENETLKLD